ncbi:Phospholipid:diacylglycerol acyltransferase, partial [Tetrabaena socialis]
MRETVSVNLNATPEAGLARVSRASLFSSSSKSKQAAFHVVISEMRAELMSAKPAAGSSLPCVLLWVRGETIHVTEDSVGQSVLSWSDTYFAQDPEGIKIRAAVGLEAVDYFIQGYWCVLSCPRLSAPVRACARLSAAPVPPLHAWPLSLLDYWVWGKLVEALADVGYDSNSLVSMPYDWRLAMPLLE